MTSTTDFDNVEITQQYSRINTRFELLEEELDNDNSSARLFERSRIKALADEREAVQKKTFTKWVNSILSRVSCRISDLYLDLRDGRMLIKLLELLSGEKLPKPTKGRMRIHCLENVDKALQFLKEQRVHLENMGSHDIVDGNHRLILGLIWTIILRFQIQDIVVEMGQADGTQRESRTAKDALLLWCQMKTAGYPNVNITNFTTSWKDGMAFSALIHKHRPDLVDYSGLKRSNPTHNLQNAFNVAEQTLGVTKLLDPEDVFTENPDEKSIITYVVAFYHYFSKMKALAVEGKRVGKVLDHAIETEKMIDKYETLSSDLLTWIQQTIMILNNRKLANSLTGVQQQLQSFNSYRIVEKPPKFQEKGNLEVLLFTIQSRMRANKQRVYTPKEGALVADLNRAWEHLEWAEHERERVLRDELIRQEKLEQMARRFDRKASMRETWLLENQRLVAQDNFGYDLPAVEAAKKKHDAIETDIAAYEERIQGIVAISKELESERYHDTKRIDVRKDNILRLWDYLQELLKARRARLDKNLTLQRIFQEMLYIINWMDGMKARLLSPDFGKHLLEVDDLLQKHALVEADITVQAERVHDSNAAALKFANRDSKPISLSYMYVKIDCKYIILNSPSQSASGAVEVEPSLGQLEGTAGDSTVPMVSEMQDASSLELLDASVSGQTPREGEPRAATLPADPLSPKAVLQEGMLGRKHDLEAAGKKASNRSWNNLYCVLKPGQLSVYKDAKSFGHGSTYHGEDPLSLGNAKWEVLNNYKKKKHVFILSMTMPPTILLVLCVISCNTGLSVFCHGQRRARISIPLRTSGT
uniref:Calponin-homology (CH) domain-containing protein n=1 Tax=Oncorhynchus mykiss TaxID=8022 RepID=A0A8K9WKU0_ONCMY